MAKQGEQSAEEQEIARLEREYTTGEEGKEKKPDGATAPEPTFTRDDKTGEVIIETPLDETPEEKAARIAVATQTPAEKTAAEQKAAKDRLDAGFGKLNDSLKPVLEAHPELRLILGDDPAATIRQQQQEREERETQARTEREKVLTGGPVKAVEGPVQLDAETETQVQGMVRQKLAALGYATVPTTRDEWKKLFDEDPGTATFLREDQQKVEAQLRRDVAQYQGLVNRAPAWNDAVADEDFDFVLAKAKQLGFPLTEEQLADFVRKRVEAKDPKVVERKMGVTLFRRGGIKEAWLLENAAAIETAVRDRALVQGRGEGMTASRGPNNVVVGAAAAGQGRTVRQQRIDPTNEDDLKKIKDPALLEKMFDRT